MHCLVPPLPPGTAHHVCSPSDNPSRGCVRPLLREKVSSPQALGDPRSSAALPAASSCLPSLAAAPGGGNSAGQTHDRVPSPLQAETDTRPTGTHRVMAPCSPVFKKNMLGAGPRGFSWTSGSSVGKVLSNAVCLSGRLSSLGAWRRRKEGFRPEDASRL